MGIAVFSRSRAIGIIASANSSSGSLAIVRTVWRALTARFRPDLPSPAPAPFMLAAAARRLLPGVSEASLSAHIAIKTVAAQAMYTGAYGQKQCQTVVKASSPRRLKVIRELEATGRPEAPPVAARGLYLAVQAVAFRYMLMSCGPSYALGAAKLAGTISA